MSGAMYNDVQKCKIFVLCTTPEFVCVSTSSAKDAPPAPPDPAYSSRIGQSTGWILFNHDVQRNKKPDAQTASTAVTSGYRDIPK